MAQTIDSMIQTVVTTDASNQDLFNYEVPPLSMLAVEVEVFAYRNQTNRSCWKFRAVGSRASGSASALGSPVDVVPRVNDAGASAWDAQILLSGNNLIVRLNGQASATITWLVSARIVINTPD